MKSTLWKLIHQWRDATTTEAAWRARDQIDIELDKIEAPEPYDQQALELCKVCGWKALIPGDGCLICERKLQQREPMTGPEMEKCWGQVKGTKFGYGPFARAIEQHHGIGAKP